jgi:DNA-binding Lrp family transcriptional regulator
VPEGWLEATAAPGSTVGDVVTAFVLIEADPARVADLAEEVAAVEGVAEAYSVAGHADIVAVVRVRRHEELAEVVTRRIHALGGVRDTRTLVAFQAYSRKDLEAMWELGAP